MENEFHRYASWTKTYSWQAAPQLPLAAAITQGSTRRCLFFAGRSPVTVGRSDSPGLHQPLMED